MTVPKARSAKRSEAKNSKCECQQKLTQNSKATLRARWHSAKEAAAVSNGIVAQTPHTHTHTHTNAGHN